MKTINRYLAVALCGSSFALATFGDKIRIEDLPTEVRDRIRVQTGAVLIEDIDRSTRDGKTQYEVALKRNGQNTELIFDQSGQLLNPNGTPALDSRKVGYAELPVVVQRALEARLRGTTPNDIDRRVQNGEITYEIGFKQGGQQQEILLSQDGRILRDVKLSDASIAAASATVTNINPQPVQLANKQKVNYDQLPAAVKRTIGVRAKGAAVEDVELGHWRARNIYEVAFKDQGQHVELQIEENGRVFHDPRIARLQAAGVPAGTISGTAASVYPDVTAAVQLSGGEKVDRRSVPAAVEQAIARLAPGAQVEDVERGSWRGVNVYEVAFKDQGRHVELQIDERGNVVFDPRKK